MSSSLGVPEEKIRALTDYRSNDLFSRREQLALEYADRMTITDAEVNDEFFASLADEFNEDEIVELTSHIAWENASSKFNRALRIESQGFWEGSRSE